MPKVSIILTSFNHAKYLQEAIDCVLNQIFSDFELIILDDCSSDNSWEIINKYNDTRIRAFRSEEIGQVVYRVNNTISNLATADYIAIHHSDDVWEPDKLEKQVAFLDAHSEIGAVFTNVLAINEDSRPLANEDHFYNNIFDQPNKTRYEWLGFFFNNGNALCHPSVLIRKQCYETCGLYRYGMAQLPDFDMWIRLCMKYEIHVLPEKLVKFRVRDHEANASGIRPETRIRSAYEYYKVLQIYRDIVTKEEIFEILPDYISYDRGLDTDAEYVLARICLEPNSFYIKNLLGLEILFDIVNDTVRRQAVEKAYDFTLKDFLAITGKYDVFSREQLTASEQIAEVNQKKIAELNQIITKLQIQIADLTHALSIRDAQNVRLNKALSEIRSSTSWRITAPFRKIILFIRKLRNLPNRIKKRGSLFSATLELFQDEKSLKEISKKEEPVNINEVNKINLSIIPYYVDPNIKLDDNQLHKEIKIAVHLHLFYTEMLEMFIAYLNNIPVTYDLFVSVPESCNSEYIQHELCKQLTKATNVIVESVPNRGRNIAPMIIQFGERLSKYQFIAHIHSKKSLKSQDTLDKLLGVPDSKIGRVEHILDLLKSRAKLVISELHLESITDKTGWSINYDIAKKFVKKHSDISIDKFPVTEFPEDGMFWSRAECLQDFLKLQLNYDDFPIEPIAADGTLIHVLERLIVIFANKYEGESLRIHDGDSVKDYCDYEEQENFSSKIIHSDIKILSYYLPQFHPIPENDLWHGKGFTEWVKVRAANPLFENHYQQHIPHPDIGYYLLDSVDTLKNQAKMMQQSGVYGQVFYHYWFSGKLILEEPAQLLLKSPDIEMPFCFCWANENWTRRWDGNESEILLGQNYSGQDAIDFIHYLFPFFNDSRYIKLDNRPVLFVYRPASIINSQDYIDIWERECKKVGIKAPFVVAVLTRGASNPKDFGMDAGVERVLHDWTNGAVSEVNKSLNSYQPINGSVLSYDEVSNFYMRQSEAKDFPYFRSVIPIFDNTARYGSEAYITHGSTPQQFQDWMENAITYTQSTLPSDQRFLLVNAWNEWAEGAHLEPDSRFGYSYLNSVGRALSDISYSGDCNPSCLIPANTKVHLSFSEIILEQLQNDNELKTRFIHCLSKSSIFNVCTVIVSDMDLKKELPKAILPDLNEADFVLELRHIVLFDSSVFEKMIQSALATGSAIIPNSYDNNVEIVEVTANNSVPAYLGNTSPIILLSKSQKNSGFKNVRIRPDARSFVAYPSVQQKLEKPVVTTIIRFHKAADPNELKNALFCLSAMSDCIVIPLIAAQDLSKHQVDALQDLLNEFFWLKGCEPQVHFFQSQDGNTDLRSKMLNESLKKVKTRYAAILDFDDLLMPHAYTWLIKRLEKSGKAVAFGRVYTTSYDSSTGLLIDRNRQYEYCFSYEEFVKCNHAPIHSIMLDVEQLDLSQIVYYDDQRYMEDYLLTLQLFNKDNCDWESLKYNFYIGDYIHSIDRSHTLAFSNVEERQALFSNPEYIVCEQRIFNIREIIHQRCTSSEEA